MRLLVDSIPMKGLLTGIGRYLRNLYSALGALGDGEINYFDGRRLSSTMPDKAEAKAWIKSTDRIWTFPDFAVVGLRSAHWLLFEMRLNRTLRHSGCDVYHETAFTPASIRRAIPQVFTLHDLSLMHYRHMHPRERVWFWDLFFRRRIKEASMIITPSEYIRSEVCERLKIPGEIVKAIPEAPDPFFQPRRKDRIRDSLSGLNLPKEYLLFVGTLEPRKNLNVIIEALPKTDCDIPLVIAGWKGWGDKPWLEKVKEYELEKRIYKTGYVDEEILACLYSGATALIFPSFYEGFGLPVLEAMACGCPVICSSAASLPEVAGDAAIYLDPNDPEELAAAIERVTNDMEVKEKLIQAGISRVRQFSWQKTARMTLKVFEQAKQSHP